MLKVKNFKFYKQKMLIDQSRVEKKQIDQADVSWTVLPGSVGGCSVLRQI